MTERETVVVGGGAMGSATAWHLARRGREVTLLERYGERHTMGASHGRTRNFNVAYDDPTYQAMVQEAAGLWRELEDESGATLLDLVGQTNHGAGVAADADLVLGALGVRAAMLQVDAARERWPGIRYDTRVLHLPEAGRVYAEDAVLALQRRSAAHGAEVLLNTPVEAIRVRADGKTEVATANTTYVADTVVVTAGAWTEQLLGSQVALPRLVVTQEQPAHFAVTDPDVTWPSWNHLPAVGDPRYDTGTPSCTGCSPPGRASRPAGTGSVRSATRTTAPSSRSPSSSPPCSSTRVTGSPASIRTRSSRSAAPTRAPVTSTSSSTGPDRSWSAPGSPATGSSSCRRWAGSSRTWPRRRVQPLPCSG